MNDEEKRIFIRQLEREIILAHIYGKLPPNFNKTMRTLESMGIDPEEVLDNAFYKFDALTFLWATGQAEPISIKKLDFGKTSILELETNNEVEKISPSGLQSFTVAGDSMIGAGIFDGDIVLARKEEFENGAVYIVRVEDYYFVKRVQKTDNGYRLVSDNPKYKPVEVKSPLEFEIVGRVRYLLKKLD